MSTSKLYQFQEWLEDKIQSLLPAGVEVICRRKGNIDSDVENSLASMGLAVVVEPPLPRQWSNSYLLSAEVESQVHIIENVLMQSTDETSYSILEILAKALHEARCEQLGSFLLILGDIQDLSPSDEPIIHFVLPITNQLNF